jgi:3-oxoadipate enol-lactonase
MADATGARSERGGGGERGDEHPAAPPLPPGRVVELPKRGRMFVRELPGPPKAPTLLLLHGWTATADLNWFTAYGSLGRTYRVVAPDLRGHGRGVRSRRPFRMRDATDDAAALLDVLGLTSVIAVGYSMGGAVAQLLWRRHRERVGGLVLCATSRTFAASPPERAMFTALGGLSVAARVTPGIVRRQVADRMIGSRVTEGSVADWATGELRRGDPAAVLDAGRAIGRFDSRSWAGEIDVPAAVVVTLNDSLVAPARQLALARSIPDATVHPVEGDHGVCVAAPRRFVPVLLEACRSVASRARRAGHAGAAATPIVL